MKRVIALARQVLDLVTVKPRVWVTADELKVHAHARIDAAAVMLPATWLAHQEGAVVVVVVLAAFGWLHLLDGGVALLTMWMKPK